MKSALFSCNSDDWATPDYIYNQVIANGMYDPCPLFAYDYGIDGLDTEWRGSNFVNPPSSHLRLWVRKSIEQHSKGRRVLMLIPARTDTKAFKMLFEYGSIITFISGRLCFNESKNSAPFPSMLVDLVGGGVANTKCLLVGRDDVKIYPQ